MFKVAYRKFADLVVGKKHKLFVDLSLFFVASYLTATKLTDWEVGSHIAKVFTPGAVDFLSDALPWFAVYMIVMRGFMYIVEAFPGSRIALNNADGVSHCCMRINDEITQHLISIRTEPGKAKATFMENHGFKLNLALVVECMHQHIASSLKDARSRDVFVSVYTTQEFASPNFEDPNSSNCILEYQTHQPIRKDSVLSRSINVGEPSFENYECVKCIESDSSTHLLLSCEAYHRSNLRRLKRIKHYIGMKLQCDGVLIGFINVEMYNTVFFTDETEMVDYVEEQLLPFRYLIEYQCLKRTFFSLINKHLL